MIDFSFSDLHGDGGRPQQPHEHMLRIVANVAVRVDGRTIYSEVEFPLVELAEQLQRWLESDPTGFQFDSMESETEGLIRFHESDTGTWRIGSSATGIDSDPLHEAALTEAVGAFIQTVISEVDAKLGIDVSRTIGVRSRRW